MRSALILITLLAGGAAGAQDLRYSNDATAQCLAQALTVDSRRACVGMSANACMGATSDGSTTVGMGYCLDQERAYWDARLNQSYNNVRAKARAQDAEMIKIGASAPRTEPALRDMQRAWIAYRDSTCDFEMSQWGGGTGSGPAVLACLMRLTGDQAMYLDHAWFGE